MQCRNCSTEIADKALICYKCGTATTEAKYQPAPLPAASPAWRRALVPTVIALALLVAAALYVERGSAAGSQQWVAYVAVAAAVTVIGIRAYARRR